MPRNDLEILSLDEYNSLSEEQRKPYIVSLFDDLVDEAGSSDDEENERLQWEYIDVSDNEDLPQVEIPHTDELQTELDSDSGENDNMPYDSEPLTAPDGTVWKTVPNPSSSTLGQHISRQRSGPSAHTKMMNIQQTFKCFMSLEMAAIIVRHTNRKANLAFDTLNQRHPDATPKTWKELTVQEFYGFLGIVIMIGANRSCNENVRDLWNIKSCPLYRATMGVNRFCALLRFICFDDANTRVARLQTDKAAPISELWEMMNQNLAAFYNPSENITIDEQLFPCRRRTSFTQYIPSKPAKYGIKVWWACDVKNSYPLKGQIDTGMSPTGREERQEDRVVKDLAVRFKGSGRNITIGNFFTTLQLSKLLLSWDLTLVGALRKNKSYIPLSMKAHKDRRNGSSIFAFKERVTMCSYVPKKNKAVILLSTMHHDNAIGKFGKPEMIHYYNKNKGGVDVMDELFSEYSTHRQAKRWPLSLYFNMIDITALAAYIVYYENNPMLPKKTTERKIFLRKLAEELCLPTMELRSTNTQIMRNFSTKSAMECYIRPQVDPLILAPLPSSGPRHKTGTCYLCRLQEEKRIRNTRKSCSMCAKPMCLQHSITNCICFSCAKI